VKRPETQIVVNSPSSRNQSPRLNNIVQRLVHLVNHEQNNYKEAGTLNTTKISSETPKFRKKLEEKSSACGFVDGVQGCFF
jgi:hypothetical protein